MRKMIAYCGLDCEKCDAYLATLHDDQALREKNRKSVVRVESCADSAGTYQLFGLPCRRNQNGVL